MTHSTLEKHTQQQKSREKIEMECFTEKKKGCFLKVVYDLEIRNNFLHQFIKASW